MSETTQRVCEEVRRRRSRGHLGAVNRTRLDLPSEPGAGFNPCSCLPASLDEERGERGAVCRRHLAGSTAQMRADSRGRRFDDVWCGSTALASLGRVEREAPAKQGSTPACVCGLHKTSRARQDKQPHAPRPATAASLPSPPVLIRRWFGWASRGPPSPAVAARRWHQRASGLNASRRAVAPSQYRHEDRQRRRPKRAERRL